jgi:methylglutaconyl-CoA hydratase
VLRRRTAELIAQLRVSDEGQEGLAAFLDRRRPTWAPTD